MAQRSYFFNDTESETKVYFAEDEARFNYLMMAGQGIAKQGEYEAYEVLPKQNMVVTVGAGAAFIKGYLHEVYDTAEDVEFDAADPTNDRIDRIVLRFINITTEREVKLAVLKGTAGTSPTPPSVARTTDTYELSIAQVRIIAGKSFIEASQITDEKSDPLVCGYSPLHNLLRGVQVDEKGLTTLPNQSYVDARNETADYYLTSVTSGDSSLATTLPSLGNAIVDRQGELSGNSFEPKSDGVYMFWLMVRSDSSMPSGYVTADMQFHLEKNGIVYEYPFIVHVISAEHDNLWVGSVVEQLEGGDIIKIKGASYSSSPDIHVIDTWFRASKMS